MTFKDYVIVMSIATSAAWIAWIVVLVSIDPSRTSSMGFLFFYITLAIALIGTLSILGAGVRVWLRKNELVSRHVSRSLRQSVLLTSLIVGTLIMLSMEFYTWWTITLFIAILALIELVFLSSQRHRPSSD